MAKEIEVENIDGLKDLMEHPKVKHEILEVLKRKLMEPLPRQHKWGWEQVRKGIKCVFPNCQKQATTACFKGYPLCEHHMHIAQFISIIIYDSVYDEENPDNLGARVSSIEIWLKNLKK